ncbi:hypothetical protein [Micromonospora sp. NPDC047187]|uniref:hypothetical protein n=1 Tax=Micromonospora sp. NPDC047187 TaxID=3155262 RepID=UPI0033F3C4AE
MELFRAVSLTGFVLGGAGLGRPHRDRPQPKTVEHQTFNQPLDVGRRGGSNRTHASAVDVAAVQREKLINGIGREQRRRRLARSKKLKPHGYRYTADVQVSAHIRQPPGRLRAPELVNALTAQRPTQRPQQGGLTGGVHLARQHPGPVAERDIDSERPVVVRGPRLLSLAVQPAHP